VDLLNCWWDNDRSSPRLVLIGDAGCGKTTLAEGAARVAMAHGVEAWDLSGAWKHPPTSTFHRWSEVLDSRGDVLEDVCSADLAVVDDIGAEVDEFRGGKLTEKLAGLLERRRDKFSVFTTNIPRAQWEHRWDKRVSSRLHHRAVIIAMKGSDLRMTL
jgi:DNA replication protein DnaC